MCDCYAYIKCLLITIKTVMTLWR